MDPNAVFCEKKHGCKPNYGSQIKCFHIGDEKQPDNPAFTVKFFELTPAEKADDHVWIEYMPTTTTLRCNVLDSGRVPRAKLPKLYDDLGKLASKVYG